MKKLLFMIALVFAACGVARADAPEKPHDVLAYCSGDWAWFAVVSKTPNSYSAESLDSTPLEQTDLFVRHTGPGEPWRPLPPMTGRAVIMASRSSQLVMLMKDGQWFTVWADGCATGEALPAGGRIKTLADDGSDLWAVGSVNGGIKAANLDIARKMASTRPSTEQSIAPASLLDSSMTQQNTPLISQTPALLLFRLFNGRWATVCELPVEETIAREDDLSLAVVGGSPLLSFRVADGGIRTIGYSVTDKRWTGRGAIAPPPPDHPITAFRILSDGYKPQLWVTTDDDAGNLYPDAGETPAMVKLKWPGPLKLDGVPTATFAGHYVCVFGPHGGKVLEQRYSKEGAPIEGAAELVVADPNESFIPRWLEVVVLAFAGFSFGANMFRQFTQNEKAAAIESPAPAPLPQRFLAGLIDAIPVIAAVAYVLVKNGSPTTIAIILGSSVLLYLLHTTLAEAITQRSAGKWLTGLKVVNIDGSDAKRQQLIWRNILRLVDPLVMIVASPLRQRTADTVMGTMVISTVPRPIETDEDVK